MDSKTSARVSINKNPAGEQYDVFVDDKLLACINIEENGDVEVNIYGDCPKLKLVTVGAFVR